MNPTRWITILGTLFGLQVLRAFFPLLVYVVKDRLGAPSIQLGLIGLAVFATAFLLPRFVRGRRGLQHAFTALLVTRGLLQVWNGDPIVSLVLALLGVVAFLTFLAALVPARLADFVAGAIVDVVLHAAFGTRDLHWGGWPASATMGVLIGAGIAVVMRTRRSEPEEETAPSAPLGWLAWGPYLVLHLELLGNVARHSARLSLATAYSGALVAAGFALALLALRPFARANARTPSAIFAAVLFLFARPLWETPGRIGVPTLLVMQISAVVLLVRALAPVLGPAPVRGRSSLWFGTGSVLLILLLFLHYAGYDLPLPLDRVRVTQAAIIALFAATFGPLRAPLLASFSPRMAGAALLFACLPLARGVPTSEPPPQDEEANIVISFNFHAGFDERGGWAFDRMLAELKAAKPDVAALQEVSRGWVVNGCADLYELTRETLGMHGVHGPSVLTDWGSAVFTREPIGPARTTPLPPTSLTLSRAVTRVQRGDPNGWPRWVVATHLHHREEDAEIRELQARALLEMYPAAPDGVLLGDFNALPESKTMQMLRAAGWSDPLGPPDLAPFAPTFPAREPVRRIDAILVGDVSRVASCAVAPPWGSDHRAVIARFPRYDARPVEPVRSPGAAPATPR